MMNQILEKIHNNVKGEKCNRKVLKRRLNDQLAYVNYVGEGRSEKVTKKFKANF